MKKMIFYILSGITGIFLFLVLGILIGNYIVMPLISRKGKEVTVPDVVGLHMEDAKAKLLQNKLVAMIYQERPDSIAPEGTVIAQKPKAESIVKEGRTVFLTISKGREMLRVPYLLGLKLEQALKIAENQGFKVTVDSVENDTIPAGRVVAMKPTPEIYVPPNTPLLIYVSKELSGKTKVMPDLTGMDIAQAMEIIEKDSLILGMIREIEIKGQGGIVILQTPKAGTKITSGDTVNLIVGKEP